MNKLFISLSLVLTSLVVHSQVPEPQWDLVSVSGVKDPKTVVGYIYHTGATGHEDYPFGSASHRSELRFICSSKGKINPIIAIFWDTQNADIGIKNVGVKVDGKVLPIDNYQWIQEGPLTYRAYGDSKVLVDALKSGHMVRFDWNEGGLLKTTVFSLTGFKNGLNDFTTSCKL